MKKTQKNAKKRDLNKKRKKNVYYIYGVVTVTARQKSRK